MAGYIKKGRKCVKLKVMLVLLPHRAWISRQFNEMLKLIDPAIHIVRELITLFSCTLVIFFLCGSEAAVLPCNNHRSSRKAFRYMRRFRSFWFYLLDQSESVFQLMESPCMVPNIIICFSWNGIISTCYLFHLASHSVVLTQRILLIYHNFFCSLLGRIALFTFLLSFQQK